MCLLDTNDNNCLSNLIRNDKTIKHKLKTNRLKTYSEFTTCFTNRLSNLLYMNFKNMPHSYKYKQNEDKEDVKEDKTIFNINLLTILKINPEPLILQVDRYII